MHRPTGSGNHLCFAQKHTENTSYILSMAIAKPSYALHRIIWILVLSLWFWEERKGIANETVVFTGRRFEPDKRAFFCLKKAGL